MCQCWYVRSQVKKAYGNDMQGMEAHEEMARMREHVLTEVGGSRVGDN